MLGYLSADIICSEKRTVSRERSSRKTVRFEEQIMSKDKYPGIFSQPNWGYCVYYPSVSKIGEYPGVFSSFSWGIFAHVTRIDRSRASENIWWIINSNILYLNTICFKAQSLWGRVQIKLIKSNLIKGRFLRRGGKPEYPGKNLSAAKRTNKLNPHMTSSLEIEPGPHWREASALTTTPPLLPDCFISWIAFIQCSFLFHSQLRLNFYWLFSKRIFQELQRNSQNVCARVENTVQMEEGRNSSGDTKESSGAETRSFSGWCCFNGSTSHTGPNFQSFSL